jgi:signal transduction histidine kinase
MGRALAAVAGLTFIGVFLARIPAPTFGNLLSLSAGLAFTFIGASSVRRLREEKQHTEALLQEVISGRDARIQAAALEERSRLAREIHDILAHTLSALSLQLETTQLLLRERPGDPAALQAVERAGRLAKEGLGEARRAVGALRGEDLPGPELLPRLVEEFERSTGVSARLTVEGDPAALSPEARLALYRTAQEALTNIRKHARPSGVDLCLRYHDSEVELTVENDGVNHPLDVSGGHGLIGMRERAELAHGRLHAGPIPAGYRVHLWLPT